MSDFKGTPGPWSVPHFASDDVSCKCGYVFSESQSGFGAVASVPFDGESESYEQAKANAKLIAAAPDLFFVLKATVENAEQRAFEDWLLRTTPSGDCESVHAQWLVCGDYEDFANDWAQQLDAIGKATA